jgi:hypothetical protein
VTKNKDSRWWGTTCPPLHTKRSLESNTNFTFQALPGSVFKLQTSCQKEKCCQEPKNSSWLFGFWPRVNARAWSRNARFDCFFHNLLNFGIFQLFLDLDISADSNEENEYRHSIVGLTVWSGRLFLCFGNVISLTAVLTKFHLLRLARSLAVILVTIGLWTVQLISAWLFISTWKKSCSVRLGELAG